MLFTALASQTCFDESGQSSPPARRSAGAQPHQKTGVICWPTMRWHVAPGKAVTFRAARSGYLRATGGSVWLTYSNTGRVDAAGNIDTTRAHPDRITGDFSLAPGEDFSLAAGETVALQAWCATAHITLHWHYSDASDDTSNDARDDASNGLTNYMRNAMRKGASSGVARSHPHHWRSRLALLLRHLLHRPGAGPGSVLAQPWQADPARPFEAAASDPATQFRLY